mmetsp:Transcript_4737/g.13492  ORF Transcript_4737/g.13492 Transcript_4737/m.13492 type:complete len:241 (-) Transcript_4737:708-1430(-)
MCSGLALTCFVKLGASPPSCRSGNAVATATSSVLSMRFRKCSPAMASLPSICRGRSSPSVSGDMEPPSLGAPSARSPGGAGAASGIRTGASWGLGADAATGAASAFGAISPRPSTGKPAREGSGERDVGDLDRKDGASDLACGERARARSSSSLTMASSMYSCWSRVLLSALAGLRWRVSFFGGNCPCSGGEDPAPLPLAPLTPPLSLLTETLQPAVLKREGRSDFSGPESEATSVPAPA